MPGKNLQSPYRVFDSIPAQFEYSSHLRETRIASHDPPAKSRTQACPPLPTWKRRRYLRGSSNLRPGPPLSPSDVFDEIIKPISALVLGATTR
ncbi:hypothetical protein EI94DRAFT_1730780 [Lactarius quietus]|nr:hypothetical protein EI94DRAFT_1730780 [Lactarius quietus]